jgi:2-keto-3-deoxy-L-rhamnonate aldolase RhmA
MRARWILAATAAAWLVAPHTVFTAGGTLNPMIALHEQGAAVFGITHAAITAGRQRPSPPGAAPVEAPPALPLPSLMSAAEETAAYRRADFTYTSYSSAQADRFMGFVGALLRAGASVRTHPILAKVPIIHTDQALAVSRIHEQLALGHAGVMLQEVESPEEIRTALAAMRFRAQGGTRPDAGVGLAAAYWGVSEEEYRRRAKPWPLENDGELVLWAIVESREGIARVREIAAVPGLTVIVVGAGTLRGVYSTTAADGSRVLDRPAFEAGVAAIASACREFKVACSHPANTAAEVEALTKQGFSVFTMQTRNDDAFAAIAAGRAKAGR